MLLVIDIGNSSISLGLFDFPHQGGRPPMHWKARLSVHAAQSADEYAITIKNLLYDSGISPASIQAAVMSSVVPQLSHTLRETVGKLGAQIPLMTVGSGVRTGVSLLVDEPSLLGSDIVANAAAAVWLYGAPAICLDFGTATVISVINQHKGLIGVAIAPGVFSALEGLRTSAAQIPYTELCAPESLLGKNTVNSVRSGLINGTAFMVEGFIDRIRSEAHLPANTPIIVTGGLADLVLPACNHRKEAYRMIHEPELTLLGLWRIYAATTEREAKRASSDPT